MARRKPRTPNPTTRTFVEAEEHLIEMAILTWVPEYKVLITAEMSNELFQMDFLRRLQTGTPGRLNVDTLIELAENGFPPAAAALEQFIDQAMNEHQFDDLPVSVVHYAREIWRNRHPRGPLRFPSTAPQLINDFKRNILIFRLINTVCAHWPQVPQLFPKNPRRSAADIVGSCLGLSETQCRRIYKGHQELAQKFCELVDSYRLLPSP